MSTIVIKGGTIADGRTETKADVLIDCETKLIIEIGEGLTGDTELDAADCYVCPGFVDIHAHLRQPGGEEAETIETGARSGALGGFTALIAMPNTTPTADRPSVIAEVQGYAKSAICDVVPSAAITIDRAGEEITGIGELYDMGVRMFTDDGTGVQDAAIMRTAMEYGRGVAAANDSDIVFCQHCEVTALSAGGVMHEGEWSTKLGLGGQPSEAEELMVARDIALSRLTGVPVHMQHMSTAGSVELIRKAKADGVRVTAEACPHHFTLTDEACKDYDTVYKVHPPLRTAVDVEAVKEGLRDGTLDCIATDHAPHTRHNKELPFDKAPPGMIGLETAFALANTYLGLSMNELVKLMSINPAEIVALSHKHGRNIEVGATANLCVVDPNKTWTVDREETASLSNNSPFHGMELTGKVRHTIFDAEAVVIDEVAQR